MSDDQAVRELENLWKAVFGGPPAVRSEAETLAQFLVDHCPPAPAYQLGLTPIASPDPDEDGLSEDDSINEPGSARAA